MNIIGIDFGHGEVSATCMKIREGQAERIRLQINPSDNDDGRKLPSVVYRNPNPNNPNTFLYSLEKYGEIVIKFKNKITELDGRKKEAFREFIKLVVKKITENNNDIFRDKDGNVVHSRLYIAAPTSWTSEEQEQYKEFFNNALTELARKDKFVNDIFGENPIEWVINESDAAFFTHRSDGYVLIIDYGSSTIDYTLMHDNKKIDIDKLSWRIGASAVESDIFMAYRAQPDTNYSSVKKATEEILAQEKCEHVNVDEWIEYAFRNEKERAYSTDQNMMMLSCNVAYSATNNELYNNEKYLFQFYVKRIDALISDYKHMVKQSFNEVKKMIDSEIEKRNKESGKKEQLSRIILSGGAAKMKWVTSMVEEVFGMHYNGGNGDIIRDSNPAYVVSDGIAEYARLQQECLAEIAQRMEESAEGESFNSLYDDAWNGAVKDLIGSSLEKTCEDYANANENESVNMFIGHLKDCFNAFTQKAEFGNQLDTRVYAKKAEFRNQLDTRVKDALKSKIMEIVASVLTEKFGVQKITDTISVPDIQDIEILPFDERSYADKIKSWLTKVYDMEDVQTVRKKEYALFDWEPGYGFASYKSGLDFDKPRKKIMREVLAKETYAYIVENDETRFDLVADEEKRKKITEAMMHSARICAEKMFYRNEVFKTKIKS